MKALCEPVSAIFDVYECKAAMSDTLFVQGEAIALEH